MKNICHISFLFILILFFASCGVKESINRDINVQTDSIDFSIPASSNTVDTLTLSTIVTNVDLSALIKAFTNQQFDITHLNSAYLTGFKIKLSNTDTLTNKLTSFQYLSLFYKSPSGSLQLLSALNNNSNLPAGPLSFPINGGPREFKTQLTDGNVTLVMKGVMSNLTTKVLKGKAVIQYQFKVSR